MSDTSGTEWLTGGDDESRPTATGTIIDTDIQITVVDVTEEQLDALDGSLEDAQADMETKDNAIREFLVSVDGEDPPDPEEMLMRRKNLLWLSMCQIWGGVQDIQPAMEQMQLPQGNR